ncbi:MAG: hypothetical protein WCG25_04505 [bacterium]
MVVIKSIFHIISINGFSNVGFSHHDIIGQHFLSHLRESSSNVTC